MTSDDMAGNLNPAMRLHMLLQEWSVNGPGEVIYRERGGDDSWWESSVDAVRWCDLTLDEVEVQREHDPVIWHDMLPVVHACRAAIFSLSARMDLPENSQREHISRSNLQALRLFARSWQPVSLDPQARGDVIYLVRRLRDQVTGLVDLDPGIRDYIVRVAANIESTLVATRIWGTVDLESQSLQLAAALQSFVVSGNSVKDEAKDEVKPLLVRLQKRISTMWWVDVVPKVISTGFDVAQQAIEQQMDQGAG